MTIKDLKPGYVVVCRNENAYVVCEMDNGELFAVRNGGRHLDLSSLLYDPTFNCRFGISGVVSEWDICAVYGRPACPGY